MYAVTDRFPRGSSWLFLLVFMLLSALPAQAQQEVATQDAETDDPPLSLEDLYSSDLFRGDYFQGGRWADEGPVVRYIEDAEGGSATHLIEYNLETDERTRLIDGTNLYAEDVDRLIQIEGYQYSDDESKVLIYTDSERVWRRNTKGYYYVYDIQTETLTPVSSRENGFQMFAKFSPGGDRVAFVRKRDLFVVDLSTGEETRLTSSGAPGTIINGTSDWVYEEEFGLRDGWSWSPDGRYIAFFQLDESETRPFDLVDFRGQYPETQTFRYPKAGEVNSEIHIGVIDMDTREIEFFETNTWGEDDLRYEYIPQMGWTPSTDGPGMGGDYNVWIFRMNREQNKFDILYGDPETMAVDVILQERSDTWIEVETGFTDLNVGQLTYLEGGEHFVWISERDGYRHLYLYERDGTFIKRLTKGAWDVTDFHGIDEDRGHLYFTATKKSPLERHLYRKRVDIDAEDRVAKRPERITEQDGWHSANLSADLRYYIDTFSDVDTPPVTTLHEIDGTQLAVLEANKDLRETLAEYNLPAPEFIKLPGADRDVTLNGYLIKPNDFDPDREYPVLVYVYGGPGSQTVMNSYGGSRYLWHAYLAREHDVIVASVDNRGTGGRGKEFKDITYEQLGVIEARDQVAAAKALAAYPYVDDERIGMWGWSYGGYLTLMSLLTGDGPQIFDTGLAVAPVTTWRQYDTIYTERYMSTPQRNEEGYEVSSPINYAGNLREEQSLLIVHGVADDNVHFQNTVQMVNALQAAGKQFSVMMYPGRNHGIYGGNTRMHLFTLLTNYVEDHLIEEDEETLADVAE